MRYEAVVCETGAAEDRRIAVRSMMPTTSAAVAITIAAPMAMADTLLVLRREGRRRIRPMRSWRRRWVARRSRKERVRPRP